MSRQEGLSGARGGTPISLVPDVAALHLFDAVTGDRLPD